MIGRGNIPVAYSNIQLRASKMKKKPTGGMSKPGKKMTMKQYENTAMDKSMDKKMLAKMNKPKKK